MRYLRVYQDKTDDTLLSSVNPTRYLTKTYEREKHTLARTSLQEINQLKSQHLTKNYIAKMQYEERHKKANETLQLKTPLLTVSGCPLKYHLLIMVTSQPENFERRSNIRLTWGITWHNRSDFPSWKTVFQLGQSTDPKVQIQAIAEAVQYQDIIFGDFPDIFYNLPIKVIMGFEWATKFCDFEFLLKTDDDVFVNIPNLFKFLMVPDIPKTRLYAGNMHFAQAPIRYPEIERHQKYKVTIQEYPYRTFPRFCSGGGITLSRDVVSDLVVIHNGTNYFKLDDVYIGMLALRLGIDAHHEKMFQLDVTDCNCEHGTIVKHGGNLQDCMEILYHCDTTRPPQTIESDTVEVRVRRVSQAVTQKMCSMDVFKCIFISIFAMLPSFD